MVRNAAPPRDADWVETLRTTGLSHTAWFGRQVEQGVGGNAIHCRYPLRETGGFLVTAALPDPIPFFRHNTVRQPVVAAACSIFGMTLRFRGAHYPGDGVGLGLRNEWSQQTATTRAIATSIGLPGARDLDVIVAGDFNAGPSDPPFKLFRDSGFVMDNDKEWGLDYILHAGRNLRKLSFKCHVADALDGMVALSDHDLIEVAYAVEEPTEDHFRAISDWAASTGGRYFGGWPAMSIFMEPVFGYEYCVFKSGIVELRHVNAAEQPAVDTRTMFTAAHDWARSHGFEHGFPNCYRGHGFAPPSGGTTRAERPIVGTYLVAPNTGEFRDLACAELGIPDPPFATPIERWLQGTDDYARRHGFVGALPTGHSADHGSGHVCGTWLYGPGVAERVFLTPNEVGTLRPPQARQD